MGYILVLTLKPVDRTNSNISFLSKSVIWFIILKLVVKSYTAADAAKNVTTIITRVSA